VFDERNTSGFGVDGQGPLVAIYTGHGHGKQTQDLAFSRDKGRTWTKYAGNPVIDIGHQDFRDPKVFWHPGTHRWVMVVALAADKRLRFYGSPDLKNWELLSEFGPAGVVDKPNWECPDLFELPIENEPGRSRWVLEADMGNGSVAGGSGGEYFTGTFDGTTFVPDSTASQWVDFGRDFYAPVSWSNIPESDGRRIWIGWMNNWETCLNPTSPWRSAMSIPREVTLRRIDGTLRLCQRPVREVETLRSPATTLRDVTVTDDGGVPVRDVQGQQLDIEIVLEPGTAKRCGLHVLAGNDRSTEIGYDAAERSIYVDRRHSGNVTFHPAFAGRHAGPLAPDEAGRVRLRILVDACSVEVFGGQGETVITDLVFPDSAGTDVKLFAVGGECRVVQLTIHPLRRVWSP